MSSIYDNLRSIGYTNAESEGWEAQASRRATLRTAYCTSRTCCTSYYQKWNPQRGHIVEVKKLSAKVEKSSAQVKDNRCLQCGHAVMWVQKHIST